jgi:hypothetical protein
MPDGVGIVVPTSDGSQFPSTTNRHGRSRVATGCGVSYAEYGRLDERVRAHPGGEGSSRAMTVMSAWRNRRPPASR